MFKLKKPIPPPIRMIKEGSEKVRKVFLKTQK